MGTYNKALSGDNTRLDWIDAARAIAMLFIFSGHWRTPDGDLERFAYMFHLQLFFLLSGMLYAKSSNDAPLDFAWKRAYRLLAPYAFFAALNTLFFVISYSPTDKLLTTQLEAVALGMYRGGPIAGELWFLPALLLIQITYHLLRTAGLNAYAIALIGLVIYVAQWFVHIPPIPYGFSNIPQYLVYFAAGDLFVTAFGGSFYQSVTRKGLLASALTCAAVVIAFHAYRHGTGYVPNPIDTQTFKKIATAGYSLCRALVISYLVIRISMSVAGSPLLRDLGRNSLILFCTEDMTKKVYLHISGMLGIPTHITSSADVLLFSVAMMLLSRAIFFKLMNRSFPWAIGLKKVQIPHSTRNLHVESRHGL